MCQKESWQEQALVGAPAKLALLDKEPRFGVCLKMADKQQENHNDSHSSSDNEEIDPSRIDKGLENFVTEHYQQQMVRIVCLR